MSASDDALTFPLYVHDDERETLRVALRSFRDDLGHEEHRIAAVLDGLLARIPAAEPDPLTLDAAEMKVTYTALRSALDDSRRDQPGERAHLHGLLDRLPGEHDVRAIDLDAELERRGGA